MVRVPLHGAQAIANDGTTLLDVGGGPGQRRGYLLRPGAEPEPFPVEDAAPLAIDASGSWILYQKDGLYLLDLRSGHSNPVAPAEEGTFFSHVRMSDDARRVIFLRNRQLHFVETQSGIERKLTGDPYGITTAAISGDGVTVYAVTGQGRLLRIDPGDGSQSEWIGKTPYIEPFMSPLIRGLAATLRGSGLSDSVIIGAPPLDPYLGTVTMWIGERKVPMVELTPESVRFLVPWDLESGNGSVRLLVEAPGENTPFYYPEAIVRVADQPFPRAGAIARQDWTQTFVGPVNTGEIIHVYAIGFGPVSPEVPDGAAAPMSEPFPRLTRQLTCSNAEIRYAGLAPGAVERVYQLDIRIGPKAGYQQFVCRLGDSDPFMFLTLNVVE
jgi:uncharacterized protein (TIGR03437 family)